ncbi:hypothetical protein Ssi03_17800 [Sphaerisporangium siamense]|uniref:Zn-dependent peptidase ImmA (M78 family) n=1 Tax=Sphaerisporangium siamense TaxID=795645 RepID=A0A7W7DDR1_9ACTN|nr:hypothetical protein [Sphaerisporangium siamense]MBB4704985.1 Zn-dependent peptidase ImmA (M78 family) [Sphaerisporangium siamense]GII83790.1 hypothetical protein Ssi03_17800 [Sphaerisporangium siamense]
MRERALRRECRRLLRELDIRPPLDVRELCARLAERRGRDIRLVAYPIDIPGPFGLWFMTDSTDFIYYQQETTRPHQDHIVLHEIGHMIAEHPSDEPADGEAITPGLTAGGRVLRRTCYDTKYEREAELIATIILEWASVLNVTHHSSEDDDALERMRASLANHKGWL